MLDVRLIENKGCMWMMGSVFSLGLAPVLARRQARQSPARLTEEEMILRNGVRIPWDQFTRVTSTDVYLGVSAAEVKINKDKGYRNRGYIRTRYVLKHTRGQVAVTTDGMYDAERVMEFILRHVPPQALKA